MSLCLTKQWLCEK